MESETKILFKEESYRIIGACMKVHRELGSRFMEAVYQEALIKEFTEAEILFESQVKKDVYYKEEKLKKYFIADFICYDKIIIEIKSVSQIPNVFYSQLKNYLTATKMELGMLVNFGQSSLVYKRILNTKS